MAHVEKVRKKMTKGRNGGEVDEEGEKKKWGNGGGRREHLL